MQISVWGFTVDSMILIEFVWNIVSVIIYLLLKSFRTLDHPKLLKRIRLAVNHHLLFGIKLIILNRVGKKNNFQDSHHCPLNSSNFRIINKVIFSEFLMLIVLGFDPQTPFILVLNGRCTCFVHPETLSNEWTALFVLFGASEYCFRKIQFFMH